MVDVAAKQKWVTPIFHIKRPDGRVWEGYAQVIAVKDGPQFTLKAQIPQLLGQPHFGPTWGGKVVTQIASEPDDVLASREGACWWQRALCPAHLVLTDKHIVLGTHKQVVTDGTGSQLPVTHSGYGCWLIGCAQVIDEHIEGWLRKGELLFKGGHHWLLNEQLPEGSVGVRSMGTFTDLDHIP